MTLNQKPITEVKKLPVLWHDTTEEMWDLQPPDSIGKNDGMAEDCNNLLGAILLQTRRCATVENTPKEVVDSLLQIKAAAECATGLFRKWFRAGCNKMTHGRRLDLNQTVKRLAKRLQRIIGEDIRLQLKLHPTPLPIRANAEILEQVLTNLAINSRDAMPAGGQMIIETASQNVDTQYAQVIPDAKPGHYVRLSVADTGTGIVRHPFLKEPPKTGGPWFSTVVDIVKKHGGFIRVESEPGKGTRFQIFLHAGSIRPRRRRQN